MTRVAVQDLVPATDYKVQVRAVSDGEYSEWSESFTFTTTQNTSIPAAPATVTWSVQADGFFATWTEVTQDIGGSPAVITSYELELTAGATTKFVVVPAQIGQAGNWSLDFQGNIALFGTPQPSISLRVRAVNNKGLKGNFSGSINVSNPVPANVTGFTATGGMNVVALTWTANTDTDLDHYEIFTGTTAGFTPSGANRVFAGLATAFSYPTSTYSLQYFKIRAVDKFGQPSAADASANATPTSPAGVDTTPPATPTGLTATITTSVAANLATSAAVSWTANVESDLAGYFLRYRQNGTTPWNTVRYDKATTSAVISNLTPYVNYDFQIAAVDWAENMSAYSATATGTGATNSAPSTPTAPTVSTSTMQAQVTVPGTKAAGGAMEADVIYYEVYASTTTGFTPATTNMLGTIPVGPAMIATFDIPASGGGATETWYFKIIAVDNGGLKSSASAQTSGTPGLIQAVNITDATITNAKIFDLAANKITAGTGIINNLSVKSVLTIGDASTTGSVQSFDYSAGTAGFKLASVGGVASLEINQGTIRTPALLIQKGENIVYPAYADFEWAPSYYTGQIAYVAGSGTIQSTDKYFNTQGLQWTTSSVSNAIDFSSSQTTHNMIIAPSTTYIISYYAMIKTGSPTVIMGGGLRYNITGPSNQTTSGTYVGSSSIPANSTWQRMTMQVTTLGTALGPAHFFLAHGTNAATVYIDGIQIEEKWSSSTTASVWTPPSTTTIDGGMIRTGSIISSATTVVNGNTIPTWSIPINGSASFANLQIRGSAVMGLTADGAATTMSSANFIHGTSGWQIRSNGTSEFRQMDADSINGIAIKAGTMTADAIGTGTLTADVAVAGSFTTQQTTVQIDLNTTSSSVNVTTSGGTFYPDDVGCLISGANIPAGATVATYVSPTAITISVNATATASDSTGSLMRGRMVFIDPTGVTLKNAAGSAIITLPTDPSLSATFTGSVTATSLSVDDYFRMGGSQNALIQGSTLTMSAGTYTPTQGPTVSWGHTNRNLTSGGDTWNSGDSSISDFGGSFYDATDKTYWEPIIFNNGDMGVMGFAAPGNPNTTYEQCAYVNLNTVLAPAALQIYSIASDATNYYIMWMDYQANYRYNTISRTQWNSGNPTTMGSAGTWTNVNPSAFSTAEFPAIHIYGGSLYVACKREDNDKLVIQKYSGTNINNGNVTLQTTKEVLSGGTKVRNLSVGKFDMGGTNVYAAVALRGGSANTVNMYTVSTSFITTSYNWPYNAAMSTPVGAMWLGTSTDDSTGKFQVWGKGGTLYDHTSLGAANIIVSFKASFKWRNDGSGGGTTGVSTISPETVATFARRSIMTLTTPTIPDIGGNSPNAVSFFVSTNFGTAFRYTDPATGVNQGLYTALRTSDAAGTTAAMATGTPATITNGSTLVLSGTGTFKVGNSTSLNAATISAIKAYVGSVTTDANGDFTFTHSAGGTSNGIFITSQTASNLTFRIQSSSGTSFTARVFNVGTGAVQASATFTVNILIIGYA